jgi:hypothetical protein
MGEERTQLLLGLPTAAWRLVFVLSGWQEDARQLATFRLVNKEAAEFALGFVRRLKVRLCVCTGLCRFDG